MVTCCDAVPSSLVARGIRFPQLMWALALPGLIVVAINQLVGAPPNFKH
jgi:hypothetical protein